MQGAKRRLVEFLKTHGPSTASQLASALEITNVAARQHLASLESSGLVVQRRSDAVGRGRPALLWSLTDAAAQLFPDHHGALTVELIDAVRKTLGDKGLDRVIDTRASEQLRRYRSRMPGAKSSLKSRVEALAALRTREGYMAEVERERAGTYLLVENHCPVCEAAESCTGLCRSELEVFQRLLGPQVVVERTEHLLSGHRRCAYRIARVKAKRSRRAR